MIGYCKLDLVETARLPAAARARVNVEAATAVMLVAADAWMVRRKDFAAP